MQEEFAHEFQKIENPLFFVALGYLHNTEEAKDAVQDAALSAYLGFYKLRSMAYFKTWMTRIVINRCKDLLKKRKYTEELTDQIAVFSNMPTEDMEIMDALCKLAPSVSRYITLRFYHDMTYEDVSKLLKQPVSTVKYRTKQALANLKFLLEGEDPV